MKIDETVLLLPCHTLDDFPYYYEGIEADNVLAGYSALWHPALIAHTGKTPTWQTSYNDDPSQLTDRLVILSKVAEDDLPGFWLDQVRHEGATVIPASEATTRDEIIAAALAAIDQSASDQDAAEKSTASVDPELVDDFLALGFGHLMSELLTVQMRYASMVDHDFFETQLVAAANAAMNNDADTARRKLQACFDSLAQSRDHYYPVDGYLIDLLLVEPSTMGEALRQELTGDTVRNLLISAATLEAMAESEPATLQAIRDGVEGGTVSLVGGDDCTPEGSGDEFALLSNEAMLKSLRQGCETFERLVGGRPKVFGRRRFGLTSTLPDLLSQTGFVGAMHFTLDGGRFAEPLQSKTLWEGIDGGTIDAFARTPIDASRPESFLCFSQRMGESMDMDHVAVVCYARWPGQANFWYEQLQRVASWGSVLGKFASLEYFLHETDTPRDHCRYTVDDYRSPYLRQAAATGRPDPISASVARTRRASERQSVDTLGTMSGVLRRQVVDKAASKDMTSDEANGKLATTLAANTGPPANGYLVTNPLSAPRRLAVEVPQLAHPPAVTAPIEAAYQLGSKQEVLVEVPALGYAWIGPDEKETWQAPRGKLLAEENVIRNEHAEVTINRETGAIQSVRCPGFRNNLLSQQLALRVPESAGGCGSQDKASYSVMVADAVEVLSAGPVSAAIQSRGRLVNREGKPLANYSQTVSLIRNQPILELDIELEPLEGPGLPGQEPADPWNAYFASRLAWADASAEIFRSVAGGSHPTELKRFEAPDFVEVRGARFTTSVLPGGLPYHRKVDDRTLDTILISGNEQTRRFKLGIGLNLKQSRTSAIEFATPVSSQYVEGQPALAAAAGWLFHLNARNVVATHWELIPDDTADSSDRAAGIRVRLQETAGRSTSCSLRSIYPVERAQRVDFTGQMQAELPCEEDRAMIELLPYQWCEVELYWNT